MERNCYLFTHFTGEHKDGEQVYFALSRDGLHFEDLNGGRPVLVSEIGERGVRDPFILRSQINGKFYIIATDLRIANGKGWGVAQEAGSLNIVIWKSDDLVHWSEPWMFDTKVPDAGCVWAPEAAYDHNRDAYLVFWASKIKNPDGNGRKQKIYRAYTRDFVEFSKSELYIGRDDDVIDTTIVSENGIFYRFSKDEVTKRIILDCGHDLVGEFTDIPCKALSELPGVEGPIAYRLHDGAWCLLVDQFAKHLGYLPLISRDIASGVFNIMEKDSYDMGRSIKRHGGILTITEEEYDRVRAAFGE